MLGLGSDVTSGSSPLTRGKQTSVEREAGDLRLIPAHAGKTSCFQTARQAHRAHPRSRGENVEDSLDAVHCLGSSPLTRGKRQPPVPGSVGGRLIPAHAGKTWPPSSVSSSRQAHPRSRGENESPRIKGQKLGGSSPLTRGKHFPTCAFTAQIDQILETLELAVSSGNYSVWVACATDAPQDQVRSIGLVLPSSRGAS